MFAKLASIISIALFTLPLAGVVANPIRSVGHLHLDARTEWDAPKTHKVTVGAEGKLNYDPEYIHAKVGDYIKFEFHPKNHTVTESSFAKPCSAIDGGFRTGFIPVAEEDKYDHMTCRLASSRSLMRSHTGSTVARPVTAPLVNPPSKGNTFEKFEEKAKQFEGKW
ncbi:hypothetical protein BN14_05673 [Rhizoctonia solani AG-1 IB]|uniref:Plastocyanin-like domain-containing protein n=1 Tax=Thanatephorus cucumeris (strain AG1-IB / isolate 7/3/14) TaxID=1108050 RepID=M5BWV6_THACB|nr:hypothetical protein BN14_05673 [Rhizoctonia solani AG-1 IB]